MGNILCRFERREEDENVANAICRFFRPTPRPRRPPILVRISNAPDGAMVPFPLANFTAMTWNQLNSLSPIGTTGEDNAMPIYEEVSEIRQPPTSSMVSQPLPSTSNNPNDRLRLAHSRPNDNNPPTIQEQKTITQRGNLNSKDTNSQKGHGAFRRTKSPTIEPPKKIDENKQFLIDLSVADALTCQFTSSEPYRLENLQIREYQNVQNQFKKTNKKCYIVTNIQKVFNPYLFLQYNLKKKQYFSKYGSFEEKLFYHGTKIEYVESICAHNFNWRFKERQDGYRFGQGVAFSPFSNYVTDHEDKSIVKVMFLVKVLIANTCIGNKNTVVPPNIFDTTTNDMAQVYIKYEDNEYYPSYVIYYEGDEDMY